MKNSDWHIAILIPARNEELLLPRCLASIQRAQFRLPLGITSEVILVSDCSHDRTAEIGSDWIGTQGAVIESSVGQVGTARAIAAQTALSRYSGPMDRCWLANTDADCEVPGDWLVNHLAIARRGFEAVAGIVDVDSFIEHGSTVESLFRLTYLIHSDGTHPHVHGANLGVRADAYLRVGGWLNLSTGEDHDLWHRLKHAGHHHLSDANLQVVTSGRRIGRAPLGFAGALAAHNSELA
jgi:glycosyltransferase involved in cell wall biosynthesis